MALSVILTYDISDGNTRARVAADDLFVGRPYRAERLPLHA